MVVCICNAIRETEVRDAVRKGATCPRSAYETLGRRPRCGQCLPFAREIIEDEATVA
ncbi:MULTISPECIES: (2Fe-2S)-binding protein [Sphingomonas]|uniref:Bacterioferritin-associated ferredoxin n=2 Tax=Sphingomonas TaxID=13687 RepID=A0A5D9C8F6_9SPHN|nr:MULTISPECIES: (2Fe-2S)-binding protein [Sphingomonas]RVT92824.1 (2Fe-2S)-binding protein [Sphingomonas crocodyli]TZG28074.1 (2Fe-2S)-binding protein [Sphingomonas montanisoli]